MATFAQRIMRAAKLDVRSYEEVEARPGIVVIQKTIVIFLYILFFIGISSPSMAQAPNSSSLSLAFSTYLGGSEREEARDIAFDGQGNIYVTGGTVSTDFPATTKILNSGTPESPSVILFDIFVTKYDHEGNLVWSTLIGGPNYDRAYAIEVDAQGFIYVAGRAGNGFPVTSGVFQTSFRGGSEAAFYGNQTGVVFKLKRDGSALVWASYFGANAAGIIRDIDLDVSGNVYLAAGYSGGSYPASVNIAFQNGFLKTPQGGGDVVVAKVTADGSQVLWATYLGGSGDETGEPSIRVDSSGHSYVVTTSDSIDAPTTRSAYDRTFNGGSDAYLAKLSPNGSTLIYGTYFGGSDTDWPSNTHNLAIDAQGNAYISGHTFSSDLPTTSGAFQRTYAGGSTGVWANDGDFFVAKFSSDGTQLLGSTYVGGSSGDGPPEGTAVDGFGNVYVTGQSRSGDFPATADAFQKTYRGNTDAVLFKLSADFARLEYATYMGSNASGTFRAVAVDGNGTVAAAGPVGPNFPLRNASQSTYAGNFDIAVVKFIPTASSAPDTTPPAVSITSPLNSLPGWDESGVVIQHRDQLAPPAGKSTRRKAGPSY